jgi:hypothetical protein
VEGSRVDQWLAVECKYFSAIYILAQELESKLEFAVTMKDE